MVWTQDYGEEYTKIGINYSTSGNGGVNWSAKKRIANGRVGWELRAMNLAMAFHGGNIFVTYENSFGERDIYSCRSADGTTWSNGIHTASLEGIFYNPDVAFDATGLAYTTYYAWLKQAEEPFEYRGQGILAKKTTWGSTKHATADRLLGDSTQGCYQEPDLAAYPNGRVYVAWRQKIPPATYPTVYVGESDDFGYTWKTPVRLTATSPRGEDPSIEVGGNGNVYAVWADNLWTKAYDDIAFSRRGPATSTPAPPEPFTETIQPTGGSLLSNDPLESVEITFPNGAVDAPTDVTYEHGATPASSLAGDSIRVGLGVYFDVSAEQEGTPVVDFNLPVTITTRYYGTGMVNEDTIALYWHDGDEWVTDGITTIGRATNIITSTTTHFTYFGLFGEAGHLIFLPLINRGAKGAG